MLYQLSYRPLLITTLNTAPRAASGGLPYCSAHASAFSHLSWSVVRHGFRLAAGLLPGDSPRATAKPRRSAAAARQGCPTRTVHTIYEDALGWQIFAINLAHSLGARLARELLDEVAPGAGQAVAQGGVPHQRFERLGDGRRVARSEQPAALAMHDQLGSAAD